MCDRYPFSRGTTLGDLCWPPVTLGFNVRGVLLLLFPSCCDTKYWKELIPSTHLLPGKGLESDFLFFFFIFSHVCYISWVVQVYNSTPACYVLDDNTFFFSLSVSYAARAVLLFFFIFKKTENNKSLLNHSIGSDVLRVCRGEKKEETTRRKNSKEWYDTWRNSWHCLCKALRLERMSCVRYRHQGIHQEKLIRCLIGKKKGIFFPLPFKILQKGERERGVDFWWLMILNSCRRPPLFNCFNIQWGDGRRSEVNQQHPSLAIPN